MVPAADVQHGARERLNRWGEPLVRRPEGQEHPKTALSNNRPARRVPHEQGREPGREAEQIAVIDRAPCGDVQQASERQQVPPVLGETILFIKSWFGQSEVQASKPHRANSHHQWHGECLGVDWQLLEYGGKEALKPQRGCAIEPDATIGTGEVWSGHQGDHDCKDAHPSDQSWVS